MHGGATGIGQALMEHVVFGLGGQPLARSFMDYAIPRADDLPPPHGGAQRLAESDNPLGVKGAGRTTTGGSGGDHEHLRDALHAVGAADVDMPATREQVWRVLHRARAPAPELAPGDSGWEFGVLSGRSRGHRLGRESPRGSGRRRSRPVPAAKSQTPAVLRMASGSRLRRGEPLSARGGQKTVVQ